jgi:capsule biosynthesis phosphatase
VKRLIFDLDDTVSFTTDGNYIDAQPNVDLIEKLKEYKLQGFEIVISTSRNMRTYKGNIGQINANTLPIILDWLKRHGIPFDEIYTGKPWCGMQGFYIDDKAIRPDEFLKYSYQEICKLVGIKQA